MLSIASTKNGSYYADLAYKDDYYHKGQEPPGQWHGAGAKEFGLSDEVKKENFLALCKGVHHETGESLVKNAGQKGRRIGWDMTFSAPKSVSALWAVADEDTREKISKAQDKAVRFALDYAEENFGQLRTGKTGRETQETKKQFFAMFEHSTSRAQDPQLHTHAVMLNVGLNGEGKTKSLESKELFRNKMLVGALYRAELSRELQTSLGVEVQKGEKNTFEIAGLPKPLLEMWSTRRNDIEKELKAMNQTSAKASAVATLKTREKKDYPTRAELFTKWEHEAHQYDFNFRHAIGRQKIQPLSKEQQQKIAHLVAGEATKNNAYFTDKTFLRRFAEIAPQYGLGGKDVLKHATAWLKAEGVQLRVQDGKTIYTTKEIDQLEKAMLRDVADGRDYKARALPKLVLSELLNDEQKKAIHHITGTSGQVKVVSGMAGAGKTTMLKEAKAVFEAQGFKVKGASLAAVAAKNLEAEAGIKSGTLAGLLYNIKTRGMQELDHKTVLVIDEAGMVGTRQMAEVLTEAKKAGAKVVLVGDEKQLQPIEHGNPFKAIGEMIGRAELKDIKRQREGWAREAVLQIASGNTGEGLKQFKDRGLISVGEGKAQMVKELITAWTNDKTAGKEKLILGTTRDDVRLLNLRAQEERLMNKELGEGSYHVNGYTFREGDRVLFTQNKKNLGLVNGDTGNVVHIDQQRQRMTVKLDDGVMRVVPLGSYQSLELGYAVTTHKAQGKTVENAYVLAGQMNDRELTYVQVSRARGETRIFTAMDSLNTKQLNELVQRSNQKELAQWQRPEIIEARQEQMKAQQERGINL